MEYIYIYIFFFYTEIVPVELYFFSNAPQIYFLEKYTYYLMVFDIDWLLVYMDLSGGPQLVSLSFFDGNLSADEWLGRGRFLWNISLHLFVSTSYHSSFSGATSAAPFHHLHPSCSTVSIVMCACAHND